jgi:signal transduction histidine kinase
MTDEDKSRHDFKNQLAIIRGFAEILLAEAAASDPRRDDFEEIHKAATAALDLLARLFPAHADTPQ